MKNLAFRRTLIGVVTSAVLLPSVASARDLFRSLVTIDGSTAGSTGTNKARKIPDLFSTGALRDIDAGYLPTDSVAAVLDIRGLRAELSYAAFSTELRFRIPGAGIDVTFDAGDRDNSLDQLEDWLQGDFSSANAPEDFTTRLLQALVAESPVDPVAGNPNSLQSRMFAADFRMGTSGQIHAWSEGAPIPNLFSADLGGGIYDADGWTVGAIDVPFHFSFGIDRLALLVDVPVTLTSTEGAWSGMASGGLGLRVAPFEFWSLTPAFRVGGVGSFDLGGLAAMYSGTITSHVRVPFGPFVFGVGNMGGFAKTIDGIEVGGFEFSYELTNWVTRNGGYIEGNFGSEDAGLGLGWRVYGSGVNFFGDDLFLDHYGEIGAGVGAGAALLGLGLELSYLVGDDYDGVQGRIGLRF
ncbi:MAG: hypothetical protein QNK04_03835 [Myxococcota bacterium]|nr:hypothetical protein [Myxococcota bacterium]